MKAKKKLPENTYTPPLAVDDAVRKSWFTTYNIDLVNRIRELNTLQADEIGENQG